MGLSKRRGRKRMCGVSGVDDWWGRRQFNSASRCMILLQYKRISIEHTSHCTRVIRIYLVSYC
jgi:hypothetical protein